MKKQLFLLAAGLTFSAAVWAADVTVDAPWVRGTVPGQKATGAFMTLTSSKDAALVGVSVSKQVAAVAEVHEMKMEGERMSMHAIPRLALPAGKPVALASGGYHIMLMGLKAPLKAGDSVDLELKIETAAKKTETLKVKAAVRDLAAAAPSGGAGMGGMGGAREHMHQH